MNLDITFKNGPVVIQEGFGSEPYHFHQNAQEIIWVLEGEAGITFNNVEYILNAEDDIILLVDSDAHMIRQISKKLRYLSFYIDLPYFQSLIRDILHVGLYCNPGYRPPEQKPYLNELRKLLAQIVWEYRREDGMQQVTDVTGRLLLLLRNHFNFLGTTSLDYKDPETFDRLFKVYDFIYEHYKERITLSDLASQIHVSRSYLSRSIKQITGMGFKDILNYVRCEEAVRLLLGSDRSITSVAYDCGFSDPKYFNQYFTAFFHANPVEFRRQYKKNTDVDSIVRHQRPITFDDALTESLSIYWTELNLQNSNPVHLNFAARSGCPDVCLTVLPPITAFLSASDFDSRQNLPHLISALESDFPHFRLKVLPEEAFKKKQAALNSVRTLPHALKTGEILFFSDATMRRGLLASGGIKTPLYYLLSAAHHLNGTWELAENWAKSCPEDTPKQMLFLAWNRSAENNLEFLLDFGCPEGQYLALKYEFNASIPSVLNQLSQTQISTLFPDTEPSPAANIFHPSCTAEILNITEYGYPFMVRCGAAAMLSVTRL